MVFDKQQSVSAEILKYMIEFPRIECLEYEKSFAKPLLYQIVNNIIMSIVKSKSLMTFWGESFWICDFLLWDDSAEVLAFPL